MSLGRVDRTKGVMTTLEQVERLTELLRGDRERQGETISVVLDILGVRRAGLNSIGELVKLCANLTSFQFLYWDAEKLMTTAHICGKG